MAVIGPGDASAEEAARAEAVGRLLGEAGAVVVCGGLGGVMEAAARGAAGAGGTVVGLLPGSDRGAANPHVTVAITTGLGEMRNALVVRAADAVVAVGGAYGTLSEIAFALRTGKPVVGLDTWALDDVVDAPDPEAAVALALEFGTGVSLPEPYYRHDLALVHHLGYGFHADMCAPGILELLAPVRERDGLVVEIGCGSGLLTRYLVDAGHRVLATDASPAMLELARATVPDAFGIEQLTMPDDPVPPADAVVSIGHPLCYLPTAEAIDRALLALARALRPGGVLAVDLEDLEWAAARVDQPAQGARRRRLGDRLAFRRPVAGPVRAGHDDVPPQPRRLVASRRRAARQRDGRHAEGAGAARAEGVDAEVRRGVRRRDAPGRPTGDRRAAGAVSGAEDAIRQAHDRAVAAGEPGYLDPASGAFVFTAAALAARGECCGSGCRHCPYPIGAKWRRNPTAKGTTPPTA